MYRKILIVFLYFSFSSFFVTGQVFRYKIGANYSGFISEAGKKENLNPLVNVLSSPASTAFTNNFDFGFETELIRPWTNNLETGLEIEYARYSGENEFPPYYNFYFTPKKPSYITSEAIVYNSSTLNFLANLKYFFSPNNKIDPFIKIFAGSSLISAELNYKDKSGDFNKNQIMFASGTKNSTDPKKAAFHFGLGAGINYNLSEKLAFYLDGTLSVINSNLLNGIPNYDYTKTTFLGNPQENYTPFESKSMVSQISFGLVFTTLKFEIPTIKKKSSDIKKGGGKTTKYLPFYREK